MFQINYRDDPSVLGNIFFFKNSLNAILDAYLISAENLTKLLGKQVTDSAYFGKLKAKMTEMLAENTLEHGKYINNLIFKCLQCENNVENFSETLLYRLKICTCILSKNDFL